MNTRKNMDYEKGPNMNMPTLSSNKKKYLSFDNNEIDIVIPWVDANDYEWRALKNKYAALEGHRELIDDSDSRFRDWDTVRFLFRGIDLFMPWVRKVHFVTWGHTPDWMNLDADRLNIVNHKEYIPEEYLPVFSANPIELNIHRIPGLAEQFVYFNDDIIALREVSPDMFFVNGLPRDYAIMNALVSSHRYSAADIALMDIEVINDHFDKNKVIRKNLMKWFNPCYGKDMFRSALMLPWPKFSAILTKHQCNAFLKSEFEEIWKEEPELLDTTCRHRFRMKRDVNQWLVRYWRLAKGEFVPIKPYGKLYGLKDDNTKLLSEIKEGKDYFICINDTNTSGITSFDRTRQELIAALEQRLPTKSSFEK